ncbi:MAG: acyltransferase [Myxococcales bacterium]|nr:acyltransferase [Myxococcales bacterium]|tara:strand:- start:344 stop:1153 length:810 start_codon:yes stop_codon:yes gene_type:complete
MLNHLIHDEVQTRLDSLDLDFNAYGHDPVGISREHLGVFYSMLGFFYKQYFKVTPVGLDHIPPTGRAMLIGNHSGSLPADGGMVMASLFFDLNPPRYIHGMVEKFAQTIPFLSSWFSRIGQFTGLPEHAVRMLKDERLLMAFPEGVRGIGKLYKDKYKLVRFGTGFMRIALKTQTPIVPFAYVGGEEAFPAMFHAKSLAKLVGVPYWPVPPYLLPVPLPIRCRIHYGEPMFFEGDGTESDVVIDGYVKDVRSRIAELITEGRQALGDTT